MKKLNQTEKIAFNQAHPKPPIQGFQVMQLGKIIFENKNAALCNSFITNNRLKNATVIPIR